MPLMSYFTCHLKEMLSLQAWQHIRNVRKGRTCWVLLVLALLYPI